ncbi:DUF2461 family protein [Nocardia sp. BMG111209]|uniref:DUF2461 family protein n=1 Tax=Nocardia sp. BMG111209 TaxID=1160137 RepID=UPI000380BDFF|nr:DUF2461 family protein [Nocardia sp. BMG111209]
MAFAGWTAAAPEFYAGLEQDNSKSYWSAHETTYRSEVHAPLALLLDEIEGLGAGRIYRPQRDTRFSADKSPYKIAACASLYDGGIIQISSRGLAVGAGWQTMAPDQLKRFRAAVDDPVAGRDLCEVIAAMRGGGIELEPGDRLKRIPAGYSDDHPRADLLRRRDLFVWREWPVEPWLATAEAKGRITGFLTTARPLDEWLTARVGPTERRRPPLR